MAEETTHYETLFIIHPVHSGRNQDLCERFRGVLEGQGATVTHFEEWGMRDLAYPIEKQGRGFYNLVQYEASAGASGELERVMRLSDEVIALHDRGPGRRRAALGAGGRDHRGGGTCSCLRTCGCFRT